jgi:hypothetical protein
MESTLIDQIVEDVKNAKARIDKEIADIDDVVE